MHVFDLIGIHVWSGGLDGGGQVIDDFFLRRRLVQRRDCVTDLKRKVGLGGAEHLRRVLIQPVCLRVLGHAIHHALRTVKRDLLDLLAIHVEDDAAKARCASVIEVDHGALGTGRRFNRTLDELGAGLGQGDDGDVVWDQFVIDQLAHKVKVGLRG